MGYCKARQILAAQKRIMHFQRKMVDALVGNQTSVDESVVSLSLLPIPLSRDYSIKDYRLVDGYFRSSTQIDFFKPGGSVQDCLAIGKKELSGNCALSLLDVDFVLTLVGSKEMAATRPG